MKAPLLCALLMLCSAPVVAAQSPPVRVDLTLSGCAIAQLDPKAGHLKSGSPEGCEKLNRATLKMREPAFKVLRLKPGTHVFRVTNQGIPWPVDFSVRGARNRALPKTAGGAINAGQAFDFQVTLLPGVYVVSSSKTPTPEYTLIVER